MAPKPPSWGYCVSFIKHSEFKICTGWLFSKLKTKQDLFSKFK